MVYQNTMILQLKLSPWQPFYLARMHIFFQIFRLKDGVHKSRTEAETSHGA